MIIRQADTERERWENLAGAVVVQAADDYRKTLRRLKRRPGISRWRISGGCWNGSSVPRGSKRCAIWTDMC